MKLNRIMYLVWIALIILLVTGVPGYAVSSEDQKLFEKALLMEEIQGRLEEAIALYRQIVDQTKDDALAAQAQLHIGISYEKLGRQAALEAYRMVIERYPLQVDAADQARTRLAALETPEPARMVARRVWSGAGQKDRAALDFAGSVSPDGRTISFAEWKTANLGLYDVASGKIRLATNTGSFDNETYNYHETSAWSPDSEQLVYTRWFGDRYELRIKKVDSPDSRLIYRNPDVWGPYEGGWSPDGKFISMTLARDDGTFQIAVYSVEEDSVKVLKSVDWRWPFVSTFSPDGKFFAYSFAPKEDSANLDIFLMAPDGSREVHLVEHPANDQFMGWLPDGSVLFKSNRAGSHGLWRVAVADGKAVGDPVLLKPNLGNVISLGTTRAGALYYGVDGGSGWDAFTVSFDPEKGEVVGSPQRVDERRPGRNSAVTWSRDGKKMAFVSSRGAGRVVVIRSEETGEEKEVGVPLRPKAMRWFPDGESLLVVGASRNLGGAFLVRPNQAKAPPEFLFKAYLGPFDNDLPQISPDGQAIYAYTVLEEQGHRAISKFTVADREFQTLFERSEGHIRPHFALSPDGTTLAVASGPDGGPNQLHLISTSSGESRELAMESPEESIQLGPGLAWTPDGRYLLLTIRIDGDGKAGERLMRVSRQGGKLEPGTGDRSQPGPRIWGDESPWNLRQLYFKPDGRTLGFTARREGVAPNAIWVLENLTTAPKDE